MADSNAGRRTTRAGTASRSTGSRRSKSSSARPTASSARSKRTSSATKPEAPANDSLVVALEVWRSVVAALEQAQYGEIGPAYAKLSSLLVQQRTADLLSDAPERAEWADLAATAQEAVTLLEPVMTAARQLVALPSRIDVDRGTTAASRGAAHAASGRPARRRSSTK